MQSSANASHDEIWVVVPVFNEEPVVREVIGALVATFAHVVCIDDGSTDGSADAARAAGACVVRHPVNLGQGAALQTGFEYALKDPRMRWVVTFDADGQHQASDVEAMLEKAQSDDLQVVFGSRFLDSSSQLRGFRKVVIRTAALWTNLTTGTSLTDAHNGLRVIRRDVVERLNLTQNRMAHASQLVAQVGQSGARYAECPVTVLYTDYSKAKGQSLWNAVNIVTELLSR
jgi:glycosyltransferase involved in cell wall biosynthesis